jgi:glycosyltransferase involved in cell wall biosynthesis
VRIAYLADPKSGNGFYRGIAPMTALAHYRGHHVDRLLGDVNRPVDADLRGVDVLHVHRYCEANALTLVREAKSAGAAVVWDDDDYSSAMPKSVATSRHFAGPAWQRRLNELKRVFRLADLVTSPSALLAERMRDWGATRTAVVENHIPDQFLDVDRRPHAGMTIGWVAGLEHQMDAERLPIRAVLQRLLDERPDVNVISIGLGLGLRSARYQHIPAVPLHELSQSAAEFDVGIAPIADLDFNRGRSNIKLKEYAAASVPWLASPIGPYVDMGERQGGRLVPDDCWHEALVRLLDRPRERRKLAKRARRWAADETLSRNAHVWEERFAEAIEQAQQAA